LDPILNVIGAIFNFLFSIVMIITVSAILLAVLARIGIWVLARTMTWKAQDWYIDKTPPTVPNTPPALPTSPHTTFEQAQLIQPQRDGRTVWQPTPTINTTAATLDQSWISATIEAPRIVKQGMTLVLRVEVSNNHRSNRLRDETMLEVEYPSSAVQVLGSELIELEPNGDTTLIYFQWMTPYLPGNYVLRFILLNYQAKTEKVLVVK